LVILDNNLLNSVKGVDYIPELKRINPKCKIYMITANSRPEVIDQACSHGIEGYLLKPFDFTIFDDLIEKIHSE